MQVEKELGFNSKKDIEEYGIEEFNKKCKESVWKNEKAFSDLTKEMGQFIDLEHPYVTYDNNYIETEWWILKKFFDEGLFYEGHKILPFCTRCGTGLASHEVAQGYKEVTANTVIVPMKKKDEDVYFLVWTTTPWTLISNVALCVNPKELYILAESRGTKFIVAKALANKVLGDDYTVLEEYSGKNLEYMEYEQLIPSLKVDKKAFFVTVADYVSVLDDLYLTANQEAFSINYRSSKRIGKSPKRHLVDPSLACASLDLTVVKLLNDHETFGLLFEALVERDLRIYMDYLDGHLYHFRDNVSGDEVDSILEFRDGEYAAVEIKLSDGSVEDAKKRLMTFYKNVNKKPKFMCIIVGHYEAVIQDKETGIYIIPITSLRP